MSTVVLCLLLFQNADYAPSAGSATDAVKRETQLREVATVLSSRPAPSLAEENSRKYAAAREQEFVSKFNKLIAQLMDFSESYKSKKSMDVKKAAAVRKAWLDLEKSEAIFRENPKK